MRRLGFLLLGVILGAVFTWFFLTGKNRLSQYQQSSRENDGTSLRDSVRRGKEAVQTEPRDKFNLNPDVIREELARTGRVIRDKFQDVGPKIADATITGTIEGKYVVDSELSARKLGVTTHDGVVTLSGTVDSPSLVSKAIQFAMETPGVKQVVANIQVTPTAPISNFSEPVTPIQ
jgi:hypothetical protein